jgi:hypothetical protein
LRTRLNSDRGLHPVSSKRRRPASRPEL